MFHFQGYIIFPNIIDIAEKIGKMVAIKDDGKVEIALTFTTVETAQLFSIATSMVALAWCYSEYHSVRYVMYPNHCLSVSSSESSSSPSLSTFKNNMFVVS